MPAPEKMERVIEHKDPAIKVKTTQSTPNGERRRTRPTRWMARNRSRRRRAA